MSSLTASSATGQNWAADVFSVVDAKDAARFAALFAEDGRFTFANAEPFLGRSAIETMVAGFFSLYAGIRHDLKHIWYAGETAVIEGDVFYTLFQGTAVKIPFACMIERDAHGLRDYRSYVDTAPLMAALAAEGTGGKENSNGE